MIESLLKRLFRKRIFKLKNRISAAIFKAERSTMEYIKDLDWSYDEVMAADYAVKIFTIYLAYELSKIDELIEETEE